jgi:hypothetical protein
MGLFIPSNRDFKGGYILIAPIIERDDHYKWGRAYVVKFPEETYYLPSVTTVLKVLEPDKFTHLEEKFGKERWAQILKNAGDRGTIMHRMLEVFLLEYDFSKKVDLALEKALRVPEEEFSFISQEVIKRGRNLFWNFYHDGFWKDIKKCVGNELFLWTLFKGGWAGTTDFIFETQSGVLVMQDFKSSTSIKDKDDILGYKCQISCYMYKYLDRFGVLPERGEILISNEEDEKLQRIVVEKHETPEYLKVFLDCLKKFQEKNGIIL